MACPVCGKGNRSPEMTVVIRNDGDAQAVVDAIRRHNRGEQ